MADKAAKAAKTVKKVSKWRRADGKPSPSPDTPLTKRQAAFVNEYLIDLNGVQAAIRAGYSKNTAAAIAAENLTKLNIALAITKRQEDRLARVEIDQDKIVRELLNIVHADANELVEFRRTCCRFCWGEGFKYQRTANEMEVDREQYEIALMKNEAEPESTRKPIGVFNERGGIGYDMRRPPHKNCAECFGQGIGSTFVKDTRNLSPAARALYAGVKTTKDGLEIKMHDKQGFAQLLMRHAGMLNDKLKLQGDPEAPIEFKTKVVIVPPKQVAKVETNQIKKDGD